MSGSNSSHPPRASQEEQDILDEIFRCSSLKYRRIGGIDTLSSEIASRVLPILEKYLHRRDKLRGEILLRFATPHSKRFFDLLFEEWLVEEDRIYRGILDRTMQDTVTKSTAARVWEVFKPKSSLSTSEIELLAHLSKYPSVAKEVAECLVEILETRTLNKSEFALIKRVKDPGVMKKITEIEFRQNPVVRSQKSISGLSTPSATSPGPVDDRRFQKGLSSSTVSRGANNGPIRLEEKLEVLARCGMRVAPPFNALNLLESWSREEFERPGFDRTLVALGMTEERPPWRNHCVNVWHFDRECIDGDGSYVRIAERLAELTEGSLGIENAEDEVNLEEGIATLDFVYAGEPVHIDLEVTNGWVDPTLFSHFVRMLARSDPSKLFLFHEIGGQDCVIACVAREHFTDLTEAGAGFVPLT